VNGAGRGPAWANSLFEDNAEFGLGIRLAIDAQAREARSLVSSLAGVIGAELAADLLAADQRDEAGLAAQRLRVEELRRRLAPLGDGPAARLRDLADLLVRRSVWLVGGDGWAYDIGYGGLDHVLAQDRDVNILVLDTEVYSNTGGQQSKATPLGAAAKYASAGKGSSKKDLGLEAMSYGQAYVARVALGADMNQVVKAFLEAESFAGPSLIIAYSPCIAHGYDLRYGVQQQDLAVKSGTWPLYRFDPRRVAAHEPPLQLDSGAPSIPVHAYQRNETRFRMSEKIDPVRFRTLAARAEQEAARQYAVYRYLAGMKMDVEEPAVAARSAVPAGPEA
jgi:pyruvate-ferredoxin/flavodoxin oxidoreductase